MIIILNLCDIGHDQVCYETGECPACKAMEVLQGKIDSLQEENDRSTIELDDKMQAMMDAEEAERA